MDRNQQQVSISVDGPEILDADSDTEASSPSSSESKFADFVRIGGIRVEEESRNHKVIKGMFFQGISELQDNITVAAIHGNGGAGSSSKARFDTFRIFSEAVAKKRGGDANVRCAWYGASRAEICEIIAYGFSRCRRSINGESYGSGIYLSPSYFPLDEALSFEPDEHGLRHLLLCHVILGTVEPVTRNSKQSCPSCSDFDSGVDNPLTPMKYVVWSPYMNSHIYPSYIVSFTASPSFIASAPLLRTRSSVLQLMSRRMRLSILASLLSRHLPPPAMAVVSKHIADLRGNKVTQRQFILELRQIVGDELLLGLIRSYREVDSSGLGFSKLMSSIKARPPKR